jgi:CubicO group peptidase (beta-lactamase class C family)
MPQVIRIILFLPTLLLMGSSVVWGQTRLVARLDSLMASPAAKEFNGVVLISRNGKPLYTHSRGFAGTDRKTAIRPDHQFILGSISKQFTAVLVLQALDAGRLQLHVPIRKYLPQLEQSWADTVTVHHLLNHTSGIIDAGKPLDFSPGSKFSYSAFAGYSLLAKIVEATSGKSYAELVSALFRKCGMKNSTVPLRYQQGNLLAGYTVDKTGALRPEQYDLTRMEASTPGGGIITTARDLTLWNENLHNGRLLKASTYKAMVTPSAVRQHPLWGEVGYGYGIQVTTVSGLPELGHSGYLKGFNASNFYYPSTGTSMVLLSNIDPNPEDIGKTYILHGQVRDILLENPAATGAGSGRR